MRQFFLSVVNIFYDMPDINGGHFIFNMVAIYHVGKDTYRKVCVYPLMNFLRQYVFIYARSEILTVAIKKIQIPRR